MQESGLSCSIVRVVGDGDCVFIRMCFRPVDWSTAEQMGPHYHRGATEERAKPTVSAGYLLYHWLHHPLTSNPIQELNAWRTFM